MRYAVLIYGDPAAYEQLTEGEQQRLFGEFWGLAAEPVVVSSGFLPPNVTPTTVRSRVAGTITTDGPFADTKEVFGGFYVVEVEDQADAIEFAGRVPTEW